MTIVSKLMMMMTKGGNHWTLDWTILQCSSSPLKTHDDADIQRLASVVWGGWEKPRFGGDIFWLFGNFQCLEIISNIKQLIKARRSNFGSTNCWWASGDEHWACALSKIWWWWYKCMEILGNRGWFSWTLIEEHLSCICSPVQYWSRVLHYLCSWWMRVCTGGHCSVV